jgi:hypothetical protein
MKSEVITITPEMAKEMLGRNSHNRPIKWDIVNLYARMMYEGRWKLNGETIIMNGDRLLNGQKRLHACVKAGVSFTTWVVEGVDTNAFDTIDQNEVRSRGQILSIAGIPNGAKVATGLQWAQIIQAAAGKKTVTAGRNSTRLSASDLREIADGNDQITNSVRSVDVAYKRFTPIVGGPLVGLHYVLSLRDEPMLQEFMSGLAEGIGLAEGDPRLALRNRLIDRKAKRDKESMDHVCSLYVYGWNAFKEGRKLSKMMLKAGEKLPFVA